MYCLIIHTAQKYKWTHTLIRFLNNLNVPFWDLLLTYNCLGNEMFNRMVVLELIVLQYINLLHIALDDR